MRMDSSGSGKGLIVGYCEDGNESKAGNTLTV
jgi:hypothetical protein